jgi:hypothetical protein
MKKKSFGPMPPPIAAGRKRRYDIAHCCIDHGVHAQEDKVEWRNERPSKT